MRNPITRSVDAAIRHLGVAIRNCDKCKNEDARDELNMLKDQMAALMTIMIGTRITASEYGSKKTRKDQ